MTENAQTEQQIDDLELAGTDAEGVVGGIRDPQPVQQPLPKVEKLVYTSPVL